MNDYSKELAELQDELTRARGLATDAGTLGGKQENGTRIIALSRTFRDDVQELRIYLHEFEGNPVIQIGPWKCDEDGRAASLRARARDRGAAIDRTGLNGEERRVATIEDRRRYRSSQSLCRGLVAAPRLDPPLRYRLLGRNGTAAPKARATWAR